jgi:hypothetical protein
MAQKCVKLICGYFCIRILRDEPQSPERMHKYDLFWKQFWFAYSLSQIPK